ncbi:unnamed protein product [Zymoseptoria tritici ST99CH_3D1]|nr:unnamed protein product [Zymoseptoria tritici ST99CH_3D1]
MASRHKSKRRAVRVTPRTFTHICQTEHMIRGVNNFNALHLQLDKEEVPSIYQTMLDAARAQRLQEDEEKLRLMTPKSTSGVLRARAMMARKFTKVSLNSFNHRCVNWTMIEQARDETGEAGGSDVDMQDAVGEEDKGIRTSKHTAAAAAAADSSRHNAYILHDQTTDAFARQNHGK